MKVKLFLEHRFKRTPDGQVWSPMFCYDTWARYLRVFSEIELCARVADVDCVASDVAIATGKGVKLAGLPYYRGPFEYLRIRNEVRDAVRSLITPGDAYIVRAPGNLATVAISEMERAGVPYAIEVVADAWDMFSPGSSNHPLRWFFRRMFTRAMRQQCATAAASLYVTEHALQRRYPPKPAASNHGVSDVSLTDGSFVAAPRNAASFAVRPLRIVCVGSFNLLYKAQDVLVKAFAKAVNDGLDGRLSLVGDGIYRRGIEQLARRYKFLDGRIEFLGQLRGGAAVREVLDRSHLFVLPSRQEGLPRAALEAMARALPCIGSNVGGFPEILEPDCIVPPNDIDGLADCLLRAASNPTRLSEMSAQNLRRAADFHADRLAVRQTAYYTAVRGLFSEFWARRGSDVLGFRSQVPSDLTLDTRTRDTSERAA